MESPGQEVPWLSSLAFIHHKQMNMEWWQPQRDWTRSCRPDAAGVTGLVLLLSSAGAAGLWTRLHGHPSCCCGELEPGSVHWLSFLGCSRSLMGFSFPLTGNLVVSLHPLQRGPDPHQHHAALHAFHVQDAQHEHEAWVCHSSDTTPLGWKEGCDGPTIALQTPAAQTVPLALTGRF